MPSLNPVPLTRLAVLGGVALVIVGSSAALAPEGEGQADAAACVPAEAGEAVVAVATAAVPLDASQQALVEHLSRRFLIAGDATGRMVAAAYRAAREVGLDPLLVLAVISVESRFNPIAESGMGAKGLMQIIPRYHLDKLGKHGGEEAVLDPESNISVGARILQDYVYRTGTLMAGLQFYNGASWDPSAQYALKVMAERDKLEQVLRAPRTVTASIEARGG
jgi:soluble lytic murein transglycosylase-like protein